jgi:predicted DsbA family dithiol-disulfide isomerase
MVATIGAYREGVRPSLTVDIWSDVICPWCYIGKRRWETAAAALHDEVDLKVVFRPYQLDPTAPSDRTVPVVEAYAKKFGGDERAAEIIEHITSVAAGEGLDFRMDRALRANTLLAHRLLWLAEATGDQYALKERLLRAYFCDGLDVSNVDVLAACAHDVGMRQEKVRDFLLSDDGTSEVQAFLEAATEAGVTAVPTFVFEGRWMVPGAQDPETFVNVVRRLLANNIPNNLENGVNANV